MCQCHDSDFRHDRQIEMSLTRMMSHMSFPFRTLIYIHIHINYCFMRGRGHGIHDHDILLLLTKLCPE